MLAPSGALREGLREGNVEGADFVVIDGATWRGLHGIYRGGCGNFYECLIYIYFETISHASVKVFLTSPKA